MKIKKFTFFYPERPFLIHIDQPMFEELSRKANWIGEKKYNGSRLELHYINNDFQFWNRHNEKLCYEPDDEVREALDEFKTELPNGYCLFDGELRHNKTKGVRQKIILWDTFIWNHELLTKPYWYRRGLLDTLEIEGEPLGRPETFKDNFLEVFKDVITDPEIEGLVMKNIRGNLKLGRTSASPSGWMYKVRKPSGRYQF